MPSNTRGHPQQTSCKAGLEWPWGVWKPVPDAIGVVIKCQIADKAKMEDSGVAFQFYTMRLYGAQLQDVLCLGQKESLICQSGDFHIKLGYRCA